MLGKIRDFLDSIPAYTDKIYVTPPTDAVLDNVDAFIETLPGVCRKVLTVDNFTISDGYITIDWARKSDFVSVTVHDDHISFFSELPDGSNVEGVCREIKCTSQLSSALMQIC
jgi:hypothetical protein